MLGFFKALDKAWTFAAGKYSRRGTFECVHLCERDGNVELVATDGVRMAIFNPDMSDSAGLEWDGKPVNIPPSVRLILSETPGTSLVLADGNVTCNGIDANPQRQFGWADKYPDYTVVTRIRADLPESVEVNGKELRAMLRQKPEKWPLEWRVQAFYRTFPKLRVYTGVVGGCQPGAMFEVHPDGWVLRLSKDHPINVEKFDPDMLLTGLAVSPRQKLVEVRKWKSRETTTEPVCGLDPRLLDDALAGRTGVLKWRTRFDPMCVEFDGETHIIMPVRL